MDQTNPAEIENLLTVPDFGEEGGPLPPRAAGEGGRWLMGASSVPTPAASCGR